MQRNNRLLRLIQLQADPAIIDRQRAELQSAVDALFQSRDGNASLANPLGIFPGRSGVLRQRIADRRADHSAQTTVVVAPTGDPNTVLLPDRLAWVLLLPVLIGPLVESGASQNIKTARRDVLNRTPPAWTHLQAAAKRATVLVSVPDTRWPLFAARTGLTSDLSLKLDTTLFEHLGWDRLGTAVSIFPLLTTDAATAARASLLPSVLLGTSDRAEPDGTPDSLLELAPEHLPAEIVRMVETGESACLSDLDRFLLFPG